MLAMKKYDGILERFLTRTPILNAVNSTGSKQPLNSFDFDDFKRILNFYKTTKEERNEIIEEHVFNSGVRLYNPNNGKLYSLNKPVGYKPKACESKMNHIFLYPLFSKTPIVLEDNDLNIYKVNLVKDIEVQFEREREQAEKLIEELKKLEFYNMLASGLVLYHVDKRYETYDIFRKINGYDMILI